MKSVTKSLHFHTLTHRANIVNKVIKFHISTPSFSLLLPLPAF